MLLSGHFSLKVPSPVQLVSSPNVSRFRYCNSVLAGLPSEELPCLQETQNNAAWLDFLEIDKKIMSLLSCLNFTGYLSNSEQITGSPLSLSVVFYASLLTCPSSLHPSSSLSGLVMRNSFLSQESTQRPSVKGPFQYQTPLV